MGRNKSKTIILIIIVLLVIFILIAGVAFAYLKTDTLKSNKELFFKYIAQNVDEKEGFIDTQLKEYFEKQKNVPYLDKGEISFNITSSQGQEKYKNANNMNVTFDGQVDKANSKKVQNVSLNYSNSVNFPFSYKQIENIIGIQTTYIGSKYVTVDTNELQNLTSSEDGLIDIFSTLENSQELASVQLTEEDLQNIQDIYFDVLKQQLQESNFTEIEENKSNGYKLIVSGEELKSVIVKLLETLSNDQTTLDKINEYIAIQQDTSKITSNDIDNIIEYINNNSELDNETLEITVYQVNGTMNSLVIKTNEIELKLEKTLTDNDLQYNIEFEINDDEQSGKIGLITKFEGLQSMQNITENYELTLEIDEIKYKYNYNKNVEFTDSINIEKFDDSNSMMLTEASEEARNDFIEAVIKRMQSVNQKQMEELGLEEDENPLIYVLPQFELYSNSTNSLNSSNEMSELEVETFNKKFEAYESTNLNGANLKALLAAIQSNNSYNEDERKIKKISFEGKEYEATEENITSIKNVVEVKNTYSVSFEKDENTGIIYKAVIYKK